MEILQNRIVNKVVYKNSTIELNLRKSTYEILLWIFVYLQLQYFSYVAFCMQQKGNNNKNTERRTWEKVADIDSCTI